MVFLWRAGGLMLVGMAFYKWGILTARSEKSFYRKGLFWGLIIGLPIIIFGLYQNFKMGWTMGYSMYIGSQFNYWGSLFIAFAYICGTMLIAQSNALPWLRERLASVGQMALTNYIAQSVICTLIFFGVGFGLFGELERIAQVGVVLAVWLIIILWSKPWLARFRFGPLEWVWRSLTYWSRQPFRR